MTYKGKWDAVEMGLSLICIVHCLLLPLFLTSLPLLGIELLENRMLEVSVVLLSALTSAYVSSRGYVRFHRKRYVFELFIAGPGLMVLGNLEPAAVEVVLKLSGSVAIVLFHEQKWRLASRCPSQKGTLVLHL